ncbi:hypothetical protein MTP99_001625 [Tenebrio molitor]|nr:hypothetical protein MTP99_001625 [Tenebrio molitor]CAH1365342.1 unnamed protein product [Tenebrio molitor]
MLIGYPHQSDFRGRFPVIRVLCLVIWYFVRMEHYPGTRISMDPQDPPGPPLTSRTLLDTQDHHHRTQDPTGIPGTKQEKKK